jgi:hypothetical protein
MNHSPQSAAERRLDRIHNDDESPISPADVTDAEVETERAIATLITSHPSISMPVGDVLDACEYDLNELRETADALIDTYNPRR